MLRFSRQIVVALTLVVLGATPVLAFTLRLAPSASSQALPVTGAADLPTPQLLRLVITRDHATLVLAARPTTRFSLIPQTTVYPGRLSLPSPATGAASAAIPVRAPLQGAELMLLRQAHTVAQQP